MEFIASLDQIRKMAALAVNASVPAGMGFMHFKPTEYKPEEIDLNFDQFGHKFGKKEGSVNLDYYEGRMVKLTITNVGADRWRVSDNAPHPEYQSWAKTYPTYQELAKAAGISM